MHGGFWVSIRGIWNNQVSRMVHMLCVWTWQGQDCGKLNPKNTQCVHCALRWSWAVMAVRYWTAAAWMVLNICNCNTIEVLWRSSCGGGACYSLFLMGASDSRSSITSDLFLTLVFPRQNIFQVSPILYPLLLLLRVSSLLEAIGIHLCTKL